MVWFSSSKTSSHGNADLENSRLKFDAKNTAKLNWPRITATFLLQRQMNLCKNSEKKTAEQRVDGCEIDGQGSTVKRGQIECEERWQLTNACGWPSVEWLSASSVGDGRVLDQTQSFQTDITLHTLSDTQNPCSLILNNQDYSVCIESSVFRETSRVSADTFPDAELIFWPAGTIMTPNYISNNSADVSLWCNCEGSGNQWQECLRLQRLFTHNSCLRESALCADWCSLFIPDSRYLSRQRFMFLSGLTFGWYHIVMPLWYFTVELLISRQIFPQSSQWVTVWTCYIYYWRNLQ